MKLPLQLSPTAVGSVLDADGHEVLVVDVHNELPDVDVVARASLLVHAVNNHGPLAKAISERTNVHDALVATLTEAEAGIAEAVRILDLMGRGGDARNLDRHRVNARAALAKAGA